MKKGLKNIKNELLCRHVCMEECSKYALKVGQTSKVHFDVTTRCLCLFDGFLRFDGKYRGN